MTASTRPTVRLTVAQAIVRYLAAQHSVADGDRRRLIPAALGIFGHGNVAGMGQALDQLHDRLPFIQGRNEQALVHAATAFAKATRRRAALAVTASIGPGALNMVTGAGVATVNRLPVLLLPGDAYATRRQGPVLQQLQHPTEADVSANDAFRPLARFFDRITRPEQLLTALPEAMRVLTDPAATGAVVLALPQDIQSHAFDYPAELFAERDWPIRRPRARPRGGGRGRPAAVAGPPAAADRRRRGRLLGGLAASWRRSPGATGIPVAETFAGKGAVQDGDWWLLGGIGLEGTPATNALARQADLVLTVGSRLTDFATASQSLFENPEVRFASINVDGHDAARLGATPIIGDARLALAALTEAALQARRSPAPRRGGTRSAPRPAPGRRPGRPRSTPTPPSTARPSRATWSPTPAPS